MEPTINRRTILIIIAVLAVILIVVLGIWFFRGSSSNPNTIQGNTDNAFPSGDSRNVPVASQDNFPSDSSIGGGAPAGAATSTIIGDQAINPSSLISGQFKHIIAAPVASATIFPTSTDKIIYLDQGSGNVYQISFVGDQQKRLSLTTILDLRQTFWGGTINSPQAIIGVDSPTGLNFSTLSLHPNSSTTESSLQEFSGPTISNNYYTFTPSPDGKKVFALTRTNGGVTGVITDFNFSNPIKIIDLTFGDWQINWPNLGTITLTTKPSVLLPGSVYTLDLKTKAINRILGGINGLITTISPDTKWLIYSGLNNGRLETSLFSLNTKSSTLLPFATLANKCVWTNKSDKFYCAVPVNPPAGQYPDDWFKGLISFNDDFWQIMTASTTAKIIADPGHLGAFDASHLFLDNQNETLFFINKKDSTVWSLDVREGF